MDVGEALVDRWWTPEECGDVTVAEATYRHLVTHVFDVALTAPRARVLAALLTGLRTGCDTGVDVEHLAAATVVTGADVHYVVNALHGAGLLRRGHRGFHAATGRGGWGWRLSGGLLATGGGPATTITATPVGGRVEFHARRAA